MGFILGITTPHISQNISDTVLWMKHVQKLKYNKHVLKKKKFFLKYLSWHPISDTRPPSVRRLLVYLCFTFFSWVLLVVLVIWIELCVLVKRKSSAYCTTSEEPSNEMQWSDQKILLPNIYSNLHPWLHGIVEADKRSLPVSLLLM